MPPVNDEQIAYWNGAAGAKWVDLQSRIDAQLAPFGEAAIDMLGPAAGERIIDVGCGCGASTVALAARVGAEGHVLGCDVSGPMLARARERTAAAGLAHVTFVEADAATHAFAPGGADAVFSRFGVMFFTDPARAFANLRRAVATHGRLGFVCWQAIGVNEWVRVGLDAAAAAHVALPAPPPPGAPGPFQLADPDRIRAALAGGGWRDVRVEPFETTLVVGGTRDLDDAVDFLLRIGPLARVLAESADGDGQREAVAAALRDRLAARHDPDGVRLGGAAWLVAAQAGT